MNKDNTFNDKDKESEGILEDSNISFEPLYELIKEDPNEVWWIFLPEIKKKCNNIAYFKNFDKDELLQEAYIFFIKFCEKYDPYYNNCFYPFDRYIFAALIQNLKAHVQHTRFKANRETVTDFLKQDRNSNKNVEYQNNELLKTNYSLEDEMLFNQSLQAFLKTLNKDERFIFTETLNGTKQKEIGEKLKMKQSRVSVILKNIRIKYLTYFNINKNEFKSKSVRNLNIEKYVKQQKRKERNKRRMW